MSDLIRRADAIKAIEEAFDAGDCYCDRYGIKGAIQFITTVEPKQGEWIVELLNPLNAILRCSVCGYATGTKYNFCPNCGARMKGEDDGVDAV